jgi:small subunit ribosomal protein S20
MPIIKSAIKRVRQQAKRRSHNLQVKRAIHADIREFTDAIEAGNAKVAGETLVAAISEIDRAVKKGTLHRNTAARRKSQLQRQANGLGTAPVAAKKPAAKKAAPKAKTTTKSKSAAKPKPSSKSAK